MPPANNGRTQRGPGAQQDRPTSSTNQWPPSLLDSATLAELPIPLQMLLVSALLPYEVAVTSVKILKTTEALLGEMVFHMNALRPAVFGVSQAYAEGQFDQFFRTIDSIQQGTNAVALVWAPLNAVRGRLIPGAPPQPAQQPPPRSPGYFAARTPTPPPVTIPPAPPSTAEYFGRIGGQLWDQAASLPGAGWMRRVSAPEVHTEPIPVTTPRSFERRRVESAVRNELENTAARPEPRGDLTSLIDLAAPLVPGPVRRLFGGS
jgi:hypothetical protein